VISKELPAKNLIIPEAVMFSKC